MLKWFERIKAERKAKAKYKERSVLEARLVARVMQLETELRNGIPQIVIRG